MGPFNYANVETPSGYRCKQCEVDGVKLWRRYATCVDETELLCGPCAAFDQKKGEIVFDEAGRHVDAELGLRGDQVGSLVPAVPTDDGSTFWGYTSVSDAGVKWWKRLPLVRAMVLT